MFDEEGFDPGLGEVRAGRIWTFDGEVGDSRCSGHDVLSWWCLCSSCSGCVRMIEIVEKMVRSSLCIDSGNAVDSESQTDEEMPFLLIHDKTTKET